MRNIFEVAEKLGIRVPLKTLEITKLENPEDLPRYIPEYVFPQLQSLKISTESKEEDDKDSKITHLVQKCSKLRHLSFSLRSALIVKLLPSSLVSLNLKGTNMIVHLHDLDLPNLECLSIFIFSEWSGISKFTGLKQLFLFKVPHLVDMSKGPDFLEHLEIDCVGESFPVALPPTIIKLRLGDIERDMDMETFARLTKLKNLTLHFARYAEDDVWLSLDTPPGLFSSLETLEVKFFPNIDDILPYFPPTLKTLKTDQPPAVNIEKRFPDLQVSLEISGKEEEEDCETEAEEVCLRPFDT